ncbi:MAG: hypothetical protein AB8E15_00390 [Bdellovibrionales bacterium]
MKNKFKFTIPLAIALTLLAVIYQRGTGPTYPKKEKIGLEKNVKIKLPRSHGGETDALVELPRLYPNMTASLVYKRYPTKDDWHEKKFVSSGTLLTAKLPNQPPAGKLKYFIKINYGSGEQLLGSESEPVMIRFKGDVPTTVLAPHVFFMFLSMFLSALAFFEALMKTDSYVRVGQMTFGCLVVGGLILGPVVQKYAFGVYWAGFPFDADLTDNKLLVGVLAWLFAVLMTWKAKRVWPVVIAATVLFGVYSIPHSMQGSEYDYEKGKVITDVD